MLKSSQIQSRKFLVPRTIFPGDQVLRPNSMTLNVIVHNRQCKSIRLYCINRPFSYFLTEDAKSKKSESLSYN